MSYQELHRHNVHPPSARSATAKEAAQACSTATSRPAATAAKEPSTNPWQNTGSDVRSATALSASGMRPSVGTSPTARSMVMRSESDVYQIWRPKPQRSSNDRARRNSTSVSLSSVLLAPPEQDASPFGHSVNTAIGIDDDLILRSRDYNPPISLFGWLVRERDRCCSSSLEQARLLVLRNGKLLRLRAMSST